MRNYSLLLIVTLLSMSFILFSCKKKEEEEEEENTFQETEDNNSFGNANALTLTEVYDGKIDPVQDLDYFYINTTSDVTLTVDGDGQLEVRVHLFDQDQIDFFGDDAGERGGVLTKTVSSSEHNGKFYIRVESAYGNDTGEYTIKVTN